MIVFDRNEKDPDSLVFASAYLMALSGLSPSTSTLAITRALGESKLKLTGHYDVSSSFFRLVTGLKWNVFLKN